MNVTITEIWSQECCQENHNNVIYAAMFFQHRVWVKLVLFWHLGLNSYLRWPKMYINVTFANVIFLYSYRCEHRTMKSCYVLRHKWVLWNLKNSLFSLWNTIITQNQNRFVLMAAAHNLYTHRPAFMHCKLSSNTFHRKSNIFDRRGKYK